MLGIGIGISLNALVRGGSVSWQDGHYLFAMFVDDSPAKDSVSGTSVTNVGNAASDTTNKYIALDGVGDWATFGGGPAFDPTANWTLEFHAAFTGANADAIMSRALSGAGRYTVQRNGTGGLDFWAEAFSTGTPFLTSATSTGGTMKHYAIVRDGGVWRFYIDGTQVDSRTSATAPAANASTVYLGTDVTDTTNRDIPGQIGRVLISDVARYPGGTAFGAVPITNKGEPVFSVVPSISGNGWVGQTLTVTETDNGTSRTYQWKQDGVTIVGATATTYVVLAGDVGHTITCAVTATNTHGSYTIASNGIGPITATDPTAAIRSSGKAYVNNASSVVFSFSTMTAPGGGTLAPSAGDKMALFAGHGYAASTPSGWTSRSNISGTNYNGAVFEKTLSAGDISTGSVTVSFAGSYYGTVIGVAFVGGTSGYRDIGASQNGTGAATRTATTGSSPQAGDYLLLFGSARVNAAVTSSSLTSALQSNTQNESSSVCRFGLAGSSGAQSGTINYAGSPAGDYQALIAIAP